MVPVRTREAGIFESIVEVGDEVAKGKALARILDPYEGEVLHSPVDGMFFCP